MLVPGSVVGRPEVPGVAGRVIGGGAEEAAGREDIEGSALFVGACAFGGPHKR